jgi:hypothetical protein
MAGLKFRKLDLHTHTPASSCYRFQNHTAAEIVAAAIERGLDAIAVTDHNTAEWIDQMQQAAAGTTLVVFPGVELSMSEGFHLIALFDPTVTQKQLENFLGAVDIEAEAYGRQDALCTRGVYDVIKKIRERNGLAILAHIDAPKGAFYEQTNTAENGQVRVPLNCSKLFNEAAYHAVESQAGRLPDGFDEAHRFTRFPAVYQASDNPDPEKPNRHSLFGLGASYSWFKMDQIDLEGLRQCFADPEVRIRVMSDYATNHCPQIVSLRIGDKGFLRYQQFHFHEGLNSIIGGKGVGKSLAVELIRFALGQPPEDAHLNDDHLGKLEKQLMPHNTVEVVYQWSSGQKYQISRTYLGRGKDGPLSQLSCLNLDSGEPYSGDLPALFPILAYSQTEVIKIAENKEAQLDLIDRFIDKRPHEQAIHHAREILCQNDSQWSAALEAQGRLLECESEIATLQAQIDQINQTLSHPLFERMKRLEDKRAGFESRCGFVGRLREQVNRWAGEVNLTTPDALPPHLRPELEAQQAIALQARERASTVLAELAAELGGMEATIGASLAGWLPELEAVRQEYGLLLQEGGGDQQAQERQRQRLEDQKRSLEAKAGRYRDLVGRLEELKQSRQQALDQLAQAHRRYYKVRKAKFDELTGLSDGKLRLSLEHAANYSDYEERLVELLKGGANAPQTSTRRQIAEKVAPRRLVELVVERDAVALAAEAGISGVWAERVIEKLWSHDTFTEVLALQHGCYPADVPTIRYRKQSGQYGELSELSVGQKCTALLIIALCDGAMPVMIDQPEDALDIVSVWEDVAKKLRRGKSTRQFILTTHNSSVAVAADSDQFIVLRASAETGKVVAAGAIDREEVRRAVIDHLEGGDEPYRLRLKKYNIGD